MTVSDKFFKNKAFSKFREFPLETLLNKVISGKYYSSYVDGKNLRFLSTKKTIKLVVELLNGTLTIDSIENIVVVKGKGSRHPVMVSGAITIVALWFFIKGIKPISSRLSFIDFIEIDRVLYLSCRESEHQLKLDLEKFGVEPFDYRYNKESINYKDFSEKQKFEFSNIDLLVQQITLL